LDKIAEECSLAIYGVRDKTLLFNALETLKESVGYDKASLMAKDIHVWPDFHGNRSPFANPKLSGAVIGNTYSNFKIAYFLNMRIFMCIRAL